VLFQLLLMLAVFTAGGARAGAPRTGHDQCPRGRSPWCAYACRGKEGSLPQTRPARHERAPHKHKHLHEHMESDSSTLYNVLEAFRWEIRALSDRRVGANSSRVMETVEPVAAEDNVADRSSIK